MTLFGIWCKDTNDWLRELPSKVDDGGEALLVFTSKRAAQRRAAKHYGFAAYAEAKRKDWCEVRLLTQEVPWTSLTPDT
jgi:hypothetical protein